jgi:succinate dehydrogenase / fumarate reductase membrane anchor subunit
MTQVTTSLSVSTPKSGENSWLWLLKLVTGPFILILILVHFVVNHAISASGLLQYSDVVAYYQVWVVPIMEIIFLGLVVSHSLLGLRSIVLDLHPPRGLLMAINWVFLILGIVSFVYGTWLILVIVSRGVTL